MRTSHLFLSCALVLSFSLTGCDQVKEKLGMEAKKEESSDKDKKKDKDKDKDKDDEDEKGGDKKEAKGDSSGTPSAPAAPAGGGASGPVGKAAAHLPGTCEVALTFNIGKVMANPAFASKVVPAIDEALKKASTTGPDASKIDAFLKETNINSKTFSEFAVCVSDLNNQGGSEPKVGMALAGDLKPDTFIQALEKADGKVASNVKDVDGRRVISDEKVTLGQFADGTLGVASTLDIFKSMNTTGDSATSKYKIDGSKEIFLALSDAAIAKIKEGGGGAPPEVQSITGFSAYIDLSANKIAVKIGTKSADDAKKLETAISMLKTQAGSAMAGAPPGTDELLKNLTTKVEGTDLVLETTIPASAMDSLATLLADAIKKETSKVDLSALAGPGGGSSASTPATPTTTTPPPAKTAATPPPAKTAATPPPAKTGDTKSHSLRKPKK